MSNNHEELRYTSLLIDPENNLFIVIKEAYQAMEIDNRQVIVIGPDQAHELTLCAQGMEDWADAEEEPPEEIPIEVRPEPPVEKEGPLSRLSRRDDISRRGLKFKSYVDFAKGNWMKMIAIEFHSYYQCQNWTLMWHYLPDATAELIY